MTVTPDSPRPKALPELRLHKPSGQGYVRLNGKFIYLGRHGLPETRVAYDKAIAEWLTNNRELPVAPDELSVIELCDRFMTYAKTYYVRPSDGKPTGQLHVVKNCIKAVTALYGLEPAKNFGPLKLRVVRQKWVDGKLALKTVNKYTKQVQYMWRWAASYEMIPGATVEALNTLNGLRRGRGEARETAPVQQVPEAHIEAVRASVSRPVRALIDLQLATGARSGEILGLRPIDIDRKGPVWMVRLDQHKGAYLGHERCLYLGPKAQEIVKPFLLDRPLHAPLFSPIESEAERYAAKSNHRHQPVAKAKTSRRLRDQYSTTSYARAIAYACKRTSTPHWHPHQLRHNYATRIRREHGLEMAQILCGHRTADVTQVYAEVDRERAVAVVAQIG